MVFVPSIITFICSLVNLVESCTMEQLEALSRFHGEPCSIWRKEDVLHGIGQLLDGEKFLLRANVPEAQRAVIADGCEGFSLWRKCQPTDSLSVAPANT